METTLEYNYENEAGVFKMTRLINARSMKQIQDELKEMKEIILLTNNKPLTNEIIFN